MEITEINVKPRNTGNNIRFKAYVNIVFDGVFAIKGLKIVKTVSKYLLCMPSKKRGNSQNNGRPIVADIAFPINREFRKYMERVIFNEYHKVTVQEREGVNV